MRFTAGHLAAAEACTMPCLFAELENAVPDKKDFELHETLLYDKKVSIWRNRGRKLRYWRGVKRLHKQRK
jgi:hypothetical protein